MENVEGYTPAQWAFGRQRERTGNLHGNDDGHLPLTTNCCFLSNLDLRVKAQNLTNEKIMKNQISRARHTRGQKPFVFKPGMLVCVWRTGWLGVGVKKQHGPGTN
eukprot:7589443-Alexandrium_andersonii.AAC.1